MTKLNLNAIVLASMMMGVMGLTACLGAGEGTCDPELDEACVCETFDGFECEDPGDLDCSCFFEDEDLALGEEEDEAEPYRYVLIEDLTRPVSGDAPGADIDAISIRKGGVERFATQVEDANIGRSGNNYTDLNELLGAPDSECQKKNFTSLGGEAAGGYVMVSFGTEEEDVTIENGDTITVYEIGRTMCPDSRFDNDPYRVSVSVTDELGAFVELGTGGDGTNIIAVTGL